MVAKKLSYEASQVKEMKQQMSSSQEYSIADQEQQVDYIQFNNDLNLDLQPSAIQHASMSPKIEVDVLSVYKIRDPPTLAQHSKWVSQINRPLLRSPPPILHYLSPKKPAPNQPQQSGSPRGLPEATVVETQKNRRIQNVLTTSVEQSIKPQTQHSMQRPSNVIGIRAGRL